MPRFRPDKLNEAQRELYDSIVNGPRARSAFGLTDEHGGLHGPFNAMLLAPQLGLALQALGAAVRFGGTLPDRAREIAILVVAAVRESGFERRAHETIARTFGMEQAVLDHIAALRYDELTDGFERTVANTAERLARVGQLDDHEYAEAQDVLGRDGLFALTTLVGYYSLLATQLSVFGVDHGIETSP